MGIWSILPVLIVVSTPSGSGAAPPAAVGVRERVRQRLEPELQAWLRARTAELLRDCRLRASDGTWLFAPDRSGHYRACWVRDFAYMVQYAGDLLEQQEVRQCIQYLLRGQRDDGLIPDRVTAEGQAIYGPGPLQRPLAEYALDNNAFMVQLVAAYVRRWDDIDLFVRVYPALHKALVQTPRSPSGLVWNDPAAPRCPYGFTDTVRKTGELLFCSALYYQAARDLAWLCRKAGIRNAAPYDAWAEQIRRSLRRLEDAKTGMFFAATKDCRQLDVWGTAYAAWVGLLDNEQRRRAASYMVQNRERIFWLGHVRHLPDPQGWRSLFARVPVGSYQNGAYWTVPLPWVATLIHEEDPQLAETLVVQAVRTFREWGIYECINREGGRVPGYVASATNVYWFIAP